jgi:hypothetical protein
MDRNTAFWTALLSGMAAPVSVFAPPPPPYFDYVVRSTVASSFAQVGLYLRRSSTPFVNDKRTALENPSASEPFHATKG